jgi:prepilin peptidase CpaA
MHDAYSHAIEAVLTVVVLACLTAAAGRDILTRTIPNSFAVVMALAGLGLRAMDGSIVLALTAALLVGGLTFIFWLRGWLGGADVKLFAALSLAVNPHALPGAIVAVTSFGAVLAIGYLLAGRMLPAPAGSVLLRQPRSFAARAWRAEYRRLRRGGPLPYAAAIAFGGIFAIAAQGG